MRHFACFETELRELFHKYSNEMPGDGDSEGESNESAIEEKERGLENAREWAEGEAGSSKLNAVEL